MSALGLLGSADLAAGVDTLLCTMTEPGIVNVRLTNRNSTAIAVRVAIGLGGSPAATDYIEYDSKVEGNSPLENTGLSLSSGEKVWVRSDTVNVSARAHGIPSQ